MTAILSQLSVDPDLAVPLVQQIREQVTWLIAAEVVRPGDRLPSVRQLAQHLGVNVNTVRAAYLKLEDDGLVKIRQGAETRVLPLDLRRLAQRPGTARTWTIGVIVPVIDNPFYQAMLHGIEDIASPHTLPFVCNVTDSVALMRSYMARLISKRVDGLIVASFDGPGLLREIGGPLHIPLVTVDWPGAAGPSVQMDLEAAGYLATRHLIEHGHQRIGLIRFVFPVANVEVFCAGWERALREAGLEPEPDLIAPVMAFDMDAGEDGMRQLLARPRLPTAVITGADMMTLGALRAVRAAGLRVPDDIAFASFNDIPLASLVEPRLTTVSAPAREMGREAMRLLNGWVVGGQPALTEIMLPASLVIRQSCGCHPQPGP